MCNIRFGAQHFGILPTDITRGFIAVFEQTRIYVGFEVLTMVVMKSTIFWDITPCSPLNVNRRFRETYLLILRVEE
jgi:hypothetical protein